MRNRSREPFANIGCLVLLDGDKLFVEIKGDQQLPELLLTDHIRQAFESI
ncbi:MAG TPA: hypothetical protein VGC14_02415 [Rhizobium sp.]